MEIGDWRADSKATLFIAEGGVNHNGDLNRAERLVAAAADAGADAVKFQTFRTEALVTEDARTADYQRDETGTDDQRKLLADLELDRVDHERLKRVCEREGVVFLSTPFGVESVDLLADLDVEAFKIGSGDLTNHPLLAHVAEYGDPMVVSTGMSTMAEIRAAYDAVRERNPEVPLALLHCVSAYPTAIGDANLRAIETMAEAFPIPVGFSDHTTAVETPALAVAAGARIIEKHFTLDRDLPGPDHEVSLEPPELDRAVSLVRDASDALGDGIKRPIPVEMETKATARKGLYAARSLEAGQILTEDDIAIKRPEAALSPSEYHRVVGRMLATDVAADQPLTEANLEEP